LAYPTEAHPDGSGPGSVRYCQFSTGSFVEPITVWDEPHQISRKQADGQRFGASDFGVGVRSSVE
jgi:hypothetical protein